MRHPKESDVFSHEEAFFPIKRTTVAQGGVPQKYELPAWRCFHGQQQEMCSPCRFYTCPQVLVLQLKRFVHTKWLCAQLYILVFLSPLRNWDLWRSRQRLNTPVSFPLAMFSWVTARNVQPLQVLHLPSSSGAAAEALRSHEMALRSAIYIGVLFSATKLGFLEVAPAIEHTSFISSGDVFMGNSKTCPVPAGSTLALKIPQVLVLQLKRFQHAAWSCA